MIGLDPEVVRDQLRAMVSRSVDVVARAAALAAAPSPIVFLAAPATGEAAVLARHGGAVADGELVVAAVDVPRALHLVRKLCARARAEGGGLGSLGGHSQKDLERLVLEKQEAGTVLVVAARLGLTAATVRVAPAA